MKKTALVPLFFLLLIFMSLISTPAGTATVHTNTNAYLSEYEQNISQYQSTAWGYNSLDALNGSGTLGKDFYSIMEMIVSYLQMFPNENLKQAVLDYCKNNITATTNRSGIIALDDINYQIQAYSTLYKLSGDSYFKEVANATLHQLVTVNYQNTQNLWYPAVEFLDAQNVGNWAWSWTELEMAESIGMYYNVTGDAAYNQYAKKTWFYFMNNTVNGHVGEGVDLDTGRIGDNIELPISEMGLSTNAGLPNQFLPNYQPLCIEIALNAYTLTGDKYYNDMAVQLGDVLVNSDFYYYPEMALNRDMERGNLANWIFHTFAGAASYFNDTENPHSGNLDISISASDKTTQAYYYSNSYLAVAGHTYHLTYYQKYANITPLASWAGAMAGLAFYDSRGAFISGTTIPQGSYGTADWWSQSLQVSAPSKTASVKIELMLLGNGTVAFDDVSLVDLYSQKITDNRYFLTSRWGEKLPDLLQWRHMESYTLGSSFARLYRYTGNSTYLKVAYAEVENVRQLFSVGGQPVQDINEYTNQTNSKYHAAGEYWNSLFDLWQVTRNETLKTYASDYWTAQKADKTQFGYPLRYANHTIADRSQPPWIGSGMLQNVLMQTIALSDPAQKNGFIETPTSYEFTLFAPYTFNSTSNQDTVLKSNLQASPASNMPQACEQPRAHFFW